MGKSRSGYTPVFDCVKQFQGKSGKKLGHITALVYGVVWRYCQFKNKKNPVHIIGKCWASYATIGEIADTSAKTVQRRIKILIDEGFLERKGTCPTLKTTIHAITPKVVVTNMSAIVTGTTPDRESEVEPATPDRESEALRTESPTIDTSGIDTSNKQKSLGLANTSPPNPSPSFEYDTLDEISHLAINGCFVFAKLKGKSEFGKYPVVGISEKRIKLQIGNEADTIKYFDPEKIQAVYENGSCKRVVLGEKQSNLCETGQAIYQDLKDLFTVSKVVSGTTAIRHYARLREIAINACNKGYGPETVKMWEYWCDQTRPELSATRSEQLTSFEKTLDIAHAWAVENDLIKIDPLQS